MASTAAANSNFHISDEIYDRARAEYEAAVHEGGGSILKDYYTIFEYRSRREKFFDKLPGWSRQPGAIQKMVKTDAELIFDEYDGIQQLDAVEVREREVAHEFPVLLPLPTTANTQTIDNFKTCPPIDGSRQADEVFEDEDEAVGDGDREANEAEEDYGEDVEDGRDVPTPGSSATHSTPVTSPALNTGSELDKRLAILRDPVNIANLTDLATPMLPGYVAPPKKRKAPPQPDVSTPPVDGVYTQKTTTSPKNFTVAPGVSSMSRYGMPAPVKSQQRQHTPEQAKMTASRPTSASKISKINPKTTATTSQSDASEPVTKKRKVEHAAAQPAKALAIPTTSQPATNHKQAPTVSSGATQSMTSRPATNNDQPPAVSSSIIRTTTSQPTTSNQQPSIGSRGGAIAIVIDPLLTAIINQTATVPSTAPKTTAPPATVPAAAPPAAAPAAAPTTASAATQRRLNDIVAGRILPRSKQEAQDAAEEQHSRLLAAYRAQNLSQSTTRRSVRQSTNSINPDPDFMPHYFSAANFPAEEVESGGCTRCVCGATENDPNKGAVVCEPCGVWQHTECLYPGVSEADLKKLDHLCTQCDPYVHRHVLKALRAGETIGGEQNGKGQGKDQGKGKAKGKAKGKSKK
jgi:hypothetical protein